MCGRKIHLQGGLGLRHLLLFGRLWELRLFDHLLELVGLADRAKEKVDGYSRGMKQRCCLATGQYSPGVCAGNGGTVQSCAAAACNGVDFKTYNPNQEDFDGRKVGSIYLGDGIGYIADDCIDFDLDGFGDYTFYTTDWTTLTDNQEQHFRGCQGGMAPTSTPEMFRGTFTPWQ